MSVNLVGCSERKSYNINHEKLHIVATKHFHEIPRNDPLLLIGSSIMFIEEVEMGLPPLLVATGFSEIIVSIGTSMSVEVSAGFSMSVEVPICFSVVTIVDAIDGDDEWKDDGSEDGDPERNDGGDVDGELLDVASRSLQEIFETFCSQLPLRLH